MKEVARNLPDTARVDEDDAYKKLKRKLESHFFSKKNKHRARLTFSKQKRIEGESVVTQKKKLEETAATSQKTRPQERRERERQKLWSLSKDRSTQSSQKLLSTQTTVFQVW